MTNTKRDEELEALLREFQASGIAELHVKTADFDLFLSNDPNATAPGAGAAHAAPAPAPVGSTSAAAPAASSLPPAAPAAAASATTPEAAALPVGYVGVVAPYLGTFYRAPKPGEPAFVELGQKIEAGTDLCLVEVMKLFTAVRSDTQGVVREVYAVDGQMVEEGQLLFAIDPAG